MNPDIHYGDGLPDESELRLIGDLSGGKRVIELGVSRPFNSVTFALGEAKAIAVDPDASLIDEVRAEATRHEVNVECHIGELADLGFATSGSVECVVARNSLQTVDDLSRTLRQVNRVLRSSRPLIMTVPHPFDEIIADDRTIVAPYGDRHRTIGDWFGLLSRNNFQVDQILELGQTDRRPTPTTLVMRAHKVGD